MGRSGRLDPFVAINLVVADDPADALGKDLSTATRQRVDASVAELLQSLLDRDALAACQVADLDHGESLEMDPREALLESAKHLGKPIEAQFWMQSAHNVEFGDFLVIADSRRVPDLVQRHGVRSRVALLLAERAQLAGCHAHIRRIDVAVDVEIRPVSVQPLANVVGEVADGQQVGGIVQLHAVLEGQARAIHHLVGDGLQAGVRDAW